MKTTILFGKLFGSLRSQSSMHGSDSFATSQSFTRQIAIAAAVAIVLMNVKMSSALAGGYALPTLAQSDLDGMERDLAANTNLHDALPPSSMGRIFGFEVGIIGGVTKSPSLNSLVQQVSTTDASSIPHAGLVGALTIPFGLTFEALYLPTQTFGGLTYQQYAGAAKWTFTDGSVFPVNLAARGYMAASTLSFTETVPSTTTTATISNSTTVQGIQLLASPKLIPILEPYVGIGFANATGTLSSSSAAPISLFSFTSAQSASSNLTSTEILAGLDVHLLLLGFGAEWSHAFNTDSYTGKLSVKF